MNDPKDPKPLKALDAARCAPRDPEELHDAMASNAINSWQFKLKDQRGRRVLGVAETVKRRDEDSETR